jgi:hypothetical protein
MFPEHLMDRILAIGRDPKDFALRYWQEVATVCAPFWKAPPPRVKGKKRVAPDEEQVASRLTDLVGVASVARLGRDILSSAIEHVPPLDRCRRWWPSSLTWIGASGPTTRGWPAKPDSPG